MQLEENIGQTHMLLTLSRNYACPSAWTVCGEQTAAYGSVFAPFILQKSRMRRRARTDLCGGRSVMIVPTATVSGSETANLPCCRQTARLRYSGVQFPG